MAIRSDVSVEICIGDYFVETRALTLEQHGAHFVLALTMVAAGGSLPFAAIPKILGDWTRLWVAICHLYDVDDHGETITRAGLVARVRESREVDGEACGVWSSAAVRI